jgi:hypothetical protein
MVDLYLFNSFPPVFHSFVVACSLSHIWLLWHQKSSFDIWVFYIVLPLDCRMGAGRKTQTFPINEHAPSLPKTVKSSATARNLMKSQLGGVIFGCRNSTIKECLFKQLFGQSSHLPLLHVYQLNFAFAILFELSIFILQCETLLNSYLIGISKL